jgi:hypothetical protein
MNVEPEISSKQVREPTGTESKTEFGEQVVGVWVELKWLVTVSSVVPSCDTETGMTISYAETRQRNMEIFI